MLPISLNNMFTLHVLFIFACAPMVKIRTGNKKHWRTSMCTNIFAVSLLQLDLYEVITSCCQVQNVVEYLSSFGWARF